MKTISLASISFILGLFVGANIHGNKNDGLVCDLPHQSYSEKQWKDAFNTISDRLNTCGNDLVITAEYCNAHQICLDADVSRE